MTISHLHSVAPAADPIDLARAKDAARDLLLALGCDLDDESVRDTPRRMAETYAELLTPRPFNATTFPNDEGYDELVVARDIPFHGVAHVGYQPGERIVGLSKLGRVVDFYARRLQVQERLTTQVARWLCDALEPRGVGVVIEAEHLCMSLRGVQKPGARTGGAARPRGGRRGRRSPPRGGSRLPCRGPYRLRR